MNTEAIITMIIITGIVWGGLVFLVVYATRKEKNKTEK
ncbi:MAG: methionine/alanine import family NSS transporter small subunit [Chlorobi bacterium]|nr:methionine/alanine import family NSS transporter small subunit [Chlorobiota bacterium]